MLDMAMHPASCQVLLEMPMINDNDSPVHMLHGKQHRLIAPATNNNYTNKPVNKYAYGTAVTTGNQVLGSIEGGKYSKKKHGMPYSNQQTASVVRRNARERNRVKQVNNGFANLRQHIPPKVINSLMNNNRGVNKKLSKVDTLRLAVEYIKSLQQLLDESEKNGTGISSAGNKLASISSRLQKSSDMAHSPNLHHQQIGFNRVPPHSPVSPTSSYTSDASSYNFKPHHLKREPYDNSYEYSSSPSSSPYSPVETSFNHHPFAAEPVGFKQENYEEYEPTINPEDEELLDTISWWQEQQ